MTDDQITQYLKEHVDDHETRLRTIERTTQNNALIISAVKWIAITIASSSIAVVFGIIGEMLV